MENWFKDGVALVKEWIAHPNVWLEACSKAHEKSQTFSRASLSAYAREYLCPCFDEPKSGKRV
jgi:hypothetical protein